MSGIVRNFTRSNRTHGWYGEILFDIPVYRLRKEEYESQQKCYVQKNLSTGDPYVEEMHRRNPLEKQRMEQYLRSIYGGPWLFNEIIGYIRLYFYGNQVRGEYWRSDAKRIVRSRKRTILWWTWKVVYEEEIPGNRSNRQILELIFKYLDRAQCELSPRYVDTSVFSHIARHIDWKKLLAEAERRR